MKKVFSLIAVAVLALFCPHAYAGKYYFRDEVNRFLRNSGYNASASLVCPTDSGFVFFDAPRSYSKVPDKDADWYHEYEPFEKSNVPLERIFDIFYTTSSDRSPGRDQRNDTRIYYMKAAAVHVDTASHIYFTIPGDSRIIHLQLVDPNMAVIKDGKLPKNSRYTRVKEVSSDGYLVTAPAAVYLWENDDKDKRLTCDIEATRD